MNEGLRHRMSFCGHLKLEKAVLARRSACSGDTARHLGSGCFGGGVANTGYRHAGNTGYSGIYVGRGCYHTERTH